MYPVVVDCAVVVVVGDSDVGWRGMEKEMIADRMMMYLRETPPLHFQFRASHLSPSL